MATLIKTTGEKILVSPQNGTDFSAEEIHDLIDGFFEVIQCKDGSMILVDDEGKLKEKEYNFEATVNARLHCVYPFNDFIVGDVLVCGPGEVL